MKLLLSGKKHLEFELSDYLEKKNSDPYLQGHWVTQVDLQGHLVSWDPDVAVARVDDQVEDRGHDLGVLWEEESCPSQSRAQLSSENDISGGQIK